MAETSDPTQPLPPDPPRDPPGEPAAPPRLRRSNSERIVAGVCGGTAEYFGIDPIIVRLAFVALALLGGSGLAFYLIAWLVMPDAREDESAALNALRGGHRPGGRSLLALALLILAIVALSGSVFWFPSFDEGLFLPLLILAAGIALLVWPADGPGWHARWHDERGAPGEWRAEREAVRAEWRRERDAWRQSRRQWRHGYRRGFATDAETQTQTHTEAEGDRAARPESQTDPGAPADPGSGTLTDPGPGTLTGTLTGTDTHTGGSGWAAPPPPRPQRRRRYRPRPFLGPLALALLLLFAGLSVFADRVDWWSTDPASFLSGCLIILGGVLVVSAFVGRARGLIWLGALLLPVAWALSAADITWWDGIGEEEITVLTLDDLEDSYRWGIGTFHVDLSDIELDGQTRELAVGLSIGELKIWVPDTMAVEIDLDGRIGSVIVTGDGPRANDDGMDIALDRRVGDPTGGTLLLDADLGIGEAEVIVCGSGGVPCP